MAFTWNLRMGIRSSVSATPVSELLQQEFSSRSGYLILSKNTPDVINIVGGFEAITTTSSQLIFTDLTGVTIVSQSGTATATIVGNTITFTAGTMHYLLLSDGTEIWFNNHTIDSNTGLIVASTSFTFSLNQTQEIPSVLEALTRGYYLTSARAKVINYKYSPSGGINYPPSGLLNFIDCFLLFPDQTQFDRSSSHYNSTARQGYYDPAQPTLRHISELEFDSWNPTLSIENQETCFTGIKLNYGTPRSIFKILIYSEKLTDSDLSDVLIYIRYLYVILGLNFYYPNNSQYIPLIFRI